MAEGRGPPKANGGHWTNVVQCPHHPDAPLIEDHSAGDMICQECGLVVGDRCASVGHTQLHYLHVFGASKRLVYALLVKAFVVATSLRTPGESICSAYVYTMRGVRAVSIADVGSG